MMREPLRWRRKKRGRPMFPRVGYALEPPTCRRDWNADGRNAFEDRYPLPLPDRSRRVTGWLRLECGVTVVDRYHDEHSDDDVLDHDVLDDHFLDGKLLDDEFFADDVLDDINDLDDNVVGLIND